SKGSVEEPEKSNGSGVSSSMYDLSNTLASALKQISGEKSGSGELSATDVEKTKELTTEKVNRERGETTSENQLIRESVRREQGPSTNIGILEKFQSVPVTPLEVTPYTTPLTSPRSSPPVRRKISGVVMEQSAAHSYFCTKSYLGSQQTSESSQAFASASSGSGTALSETSVQMTQQLESVSRTAMALETGQKLAKKRRPKPSTLREMNFWAPTSM
ncbi:hypothetical protein SK128_027169, partial [Halocaridina rubra]